MPLLRLSRPLSRAITVARRRTVASRRPKMTDSVTRGAQAEAAVQRNPHPDFKKVQASRPDWDASLNFHYTKTAAPEWEFGSGANHLAGADDAGKAHVAIDPYAEGRPAPFNYKLLISAVVPRPIAFVSTRGADGKTTNLAPFSYFNMVNADPPMFVVGFATGLDAAKDTLRNVVDTKECVINIISETFVEAANATSVNAPYDVSEWDISGLTPVYDCSTVKCARVKEAVFSVECKLDFFKEWESKATPGKKTGTMGLFEGTRFWVREDALNKEQNLIDPTVRFLTCSKCPLLGLLPCWRVLTAYAGTEAHQPSWRSHIWQADRGHGDPQARLQQGYWGRRGCGEAEGEAFKLVRRTTEWPWERCHWHAPF